MGQASWRGIWCIAFNDFNFYSALKSVTVGQKTSRKCHLSDAIDGKSPIFVTTTGYFKVGYGTE